MAAEVSGRAFLGVIRQVKDKHGGDALRRAIDASGEGVRATFAQPIRILQWYPYPDFVAFLRSLQRDLGSGDPSFCRSLGAVAGERDLGTVFKIYRALSSPERLIRSCDKIWPSYYRDAGRMEATEWKPEGSTVRISDFPAMDPLHCRLMEGWMISTMRQIGLQVNDDAREVKCPRHGAPYHEFSCTWRKGN